MSIREDATTLLLHLAQLQAADPNLRHEYVERLELDDALKMGPQRLSDAAALLEENGYADVLKTFGTAPYDFNAVLLTSRGRFEAERLMEAAKAAGDESSPDEPAPVGATPVGANRQAATVTRFAQPVGSPFGFTPADWEASALTTKTRHG
jgi:hypothetical protein